MLTGTFKNLSLSTVHLFALVKIGGLFSFVVLLSLWVLLYSSRPFLQGTSNHLLCNWSCVKMICRSGTSALITRAHCS